jgi:hypothetical protein
LVVKILSWFGRLGHGGQRRTVQCAIRGRAAWYPASAERATEPIGFGAGMNDDTTTEPPMAKPMHRWTALALAALLAGCTSASPSLVTPGASATPVTSVEPSASPARGPDSDLALLLRTLEGTHPEPFHAVSREEFVAALDAYEVALPSI